MPIPWEVKPGVHSCEPFCVPHTEDYAMRGDDPRQAAMFSHLSPEERVPTEHPLRAIRARVAGVLTELSRQCDARSSATGRPSTLPEKLPRALLRPVRYTIRSERRRSSREFTAVGCRKKPPVAQPELLLAPLSCF